MDPTDPSIVAVNAKLDAAQQELSEAQGKLDAAKEAMGSHIQEKSRLVPTTWHHTLRHSMHAWKVSRMSTGGGC